MTEYASRGVIFAGFGQNGGGVLRYGRMTDGLSHPRGGCW